MTHELIMISEFKFLEGESFKKMAELSGSWEGQEG
jgi:hypothetical protein